MKRIVAIVSSAALAVLLVGLSLTTASAEPRTVGPYDTTPSGKWGPGSRPEGPTQGRVPM